MMLVADKSMSDFYKDDLEEYLLSIMNSVRWMLDISVGRGCQGFISHIMTNMCTGALSTTRLLISTVSFVCVSTPLFSIYLRFSPWLSATVSICASFLYRSALLSFCLRGCHSLSVYLSFYPLAFLSLCLYFSVFCFFPCSSLCHSVCFVFFLFLYFCHCPSCLSFVS